MRYRNAWSGVRFGLIALACAQLAGCATARNVTRGAGATIGGLGALVVMLALSPDCDPDTAMCPNDEPYYEQDTLETRTALIAGGGVAMLVGGGLVAVAQPPKKRKRPAPTPVPPTVTAAPPPSPAVRQMRALIEKRCGPKGSIDLRVPQASSEPRAPLPPCD